LAGFCLATLVGAVASIPSASGAYVDCRLCHLDPLPGSAAKDYLEYFSEPERTHVVGVNYPRLPAAGYRPLTGQATGVAYFDRNGNGIVDADEIQVFGVDAKVECSSCHVEHGDGSPPPANPNMYLRILNTGDALCGTCHDL
jgi:hypothetical protein